MPPRAEGETAPRGRGRPRAGLDEVTLDAVIDLLIEKGARGLTIEGVAKRAGTTRPAIYRRWPNLDELLSAALNRALMAALGRTTLSGPTSIDAMDLKSALRQVMRRTQQAWGDVRYRASYLAALEHAGTHEPTRNSLRLHREHFERFSRQVFQERFAKDDPSALLKLELVSTLATQAQLVRMEPLSEAQIEAVCALLG